MAEQDRKPRSLLIADSEILVRHAIAAYLRECGYDVIEAATYEEALVVLESDKITPELVLSDVELKGEGNGFALRAWVMGNHPALPVVLAGNVEAAARAAAGICEKGPHLARPYDPQGVADHVRQLLAIRESATSSVGAKD